MTARNLVWEDFPARIVADGQKLWVIMGDHDFIKMEIEAIECILVYLAGLPEAGQFVRLTG